MTTTVERQTAAEPALLRRLERLGLAGHEKEWTDRYLLCNHLINPPSAQPRQKFEATSRFIRDLIAHRWARTRRSREEANPKRIHYLSMEFLLGRSLRNNMMNLSAEPIVRHAMEQEGWNLEQLIEEEPDAGLGNGGLGRLAACFIDSLATLQYPAIGYGLRYEYGIFRQTIRDGWQEALTIGTRDGATIEMAQQAGEENFFLFGLTAEQVADSAGWYDPNWHYQNESETRDALDLISSDYFSKHEPGIFRPILDALLTHGDRFRHLADLTDYGRAHRDLATSYADPDAWAKKAIINVARSGLFSSDRTITEYANEIWDLKPSPVQ
jgi:glucan phosphorylase